VLKTIDIGYGAYWLGL